MARRRPWNAFALAPVLVGAAACAPTVTIADESAGGGEAGDVASGGSSDKGGNGQGGTSGTGLLSGGTAGMGGGGTGGTSGSGANGTGGTEASRIYLHDENNHRSDVSFSIPTVETASGVDLDVCWTEATSDLSCANVDPLRDIGAAAMMRFNISEQEVAQLMAQGELRMEQLDGFVAYESAHDSTCTTLFSLTNFGTPVDFSEEYTEGDRTYLFTFQRGTILGSATATMVFAKPSASSTNTRLDAPPGCGLRTVTTDLATLEPVQVPFEGPWLVDWSNVTSDGQGNPFNGSNVDRLTLWFVAGGTPSNVEDLIPELDVLATEIYDAEIAGSPVVDLAFLSNPRDGQPFSTFRTNEAGVWLFGLRCSVCMNAELPLVLAVFEPIEPR